MSKLTHTSESTAGRKGFRRIFDVFAFLGALAIMFGVNSRLAGSEGLANIPFIAGREHIVLPVMIVLFLLLTMYIWRAYRHYKMNAKLVVAFVGISFLIVMGVQQVATRGIRSALTEEIGSTFEAQANAIGNDVNRFFQDKINQLWALTLVDEVKIQLAARNENYSGSDQTITTRLAELNAQWAIAGNTDPLVVQTISDDEVVNPIGHQIHDYLESFPAHIELSVTDRYGALVSASHRQADYYQADQGWWQAAWNDGAGAIYISQPQYDENSGAATLLLAVPIYSEESEEVLGILHSTLLLDEIQTVIGEVVWGETGHILLLNSNGELVIDPHAEEETNAGEFDAELKATFTNGGSGYVFGKNEEGEDAFFGFAPLHEEDDIHEEGDALVEQIEEAVHALGWYGIVQQDFAEAFAAITVFDRLIQIASLVAIVGAALMGYIMARFLVQPIESLSQVVEAVGKGQLDVTLPKTGDDEIGVLVQSFAQMVSRLKDSLQNLQDRNRDLDLASEIGRELTRARELAETLSDSAEIIRDRYGLYYAQIYLVDPSGRHLILRAGTGESGRLLVQRGHRLVIGPGSLNGMAAARRAPVVVADTERSESHRPNPLLPETRSELAIPLVAGDELVGILDLQSERPNYFAESSVVSFEALAAQLAIAIQNAALFTETQAARAETEQYTRRLLNEGWQGFLNGIERQEKMVAAYDLSDELPLQAVDETPANLDQLAVPIQLAGLPIGHIRLEDKGERGWTEQETEILRAVADKVANHLENLRLLAEADQYRRQTEEATRRLTRQNWQDYLDSSQQKNLGYVYDQNQVVDSAEPDPQADLKRPLSVDGEIIGEIALSGMDVLDEDANVILQQVITKASNRLWTLHLVEQTEQALAQTEVQADRLRHLNDLGNELSSTQTNNEAFAVVARTLGEIIRHERMSATFLDQATKQLEVFALDGQSGAIAVGSKLPVQGTAVGAVVTQLRALRIGDLLESPYLENQKLAEAGLRSTLVVPLVSGRTVLGTLNMASSRVNAFDEQDEALLLQIAPLLASTLESQRLFAEAREQARRERMLNSIGQKIRGTVTLESALQTAVQEMARALDVPYVQLHMSTGRSEGAEEMLPLTPGEIMPPWFNGDNDEPQGQS